MSEQPVRSTLSAQVQKWAGDDKVKDILDEIDDYTKKVRLQCGHCNKISYVDRPDSEKKLKALLEVIEQTEGKPGTVDGDPGGTVIIVERVWPGGVVGDGSENPGDVPAAHTADALPPVEGEG